MENNLPNEELICLLCGSRKVNGACPNECNIPTCEVKNDEE